MTGDEEKQDEKELKSITSINLLKRDCSNATEIGKNVDIKYIDLTLKKKTKQHFKDLISCFGIKNTDPAEILRDKAADLKRHNILLLTSDQKSKLDSAESIRLSKALEI